MMPLVIIRRETNRIASFPEQMKVNSVPTMDGIHYGIALEFDTEAAGRFFVSGTAKNGQIDGKISSGLVNGIEPKNGGTEISKKPEIKGPTPYVCLKLSAGDDKAPPEIVCQATFGTVGNIYYHPLAIFKDTGKIAQLAYADYRWTAKQVGGKWRHFVTVA